MQGKWEADRGPQYLSYDFWWHLGHGTMVTSEWGTPNMVKDGLNPELLLAGKYGHALHVWDLQTRKHKQTLDLGAEQQMVLELRPAHDPTKPYGFAGVVMSLKDLSASIWLWYLEGTNGDAEWKVKKVIEIPAEPASPDDLPPLLKGFGAVPPLVTDLNLSLDDRFLYVSCWGTGQLLQYDVSDPFNPRRIGEVRSAASCSGRRIRRSPRSRSTVGPRWWRSAGTAAASTSPTRFTRRGTSSSTPTGSRAGWLSWTSVEAGAMQLDERFFVQMDGMRAHQVRLEGGDAIRLVLLLMSGLELRTGAGPAGTWCGARDQPGHGLAVRGRPRDAGAPSRRGGSGPAPLGLGHALAVAAAVAVALAIGAVIPIEWFRWPVAGLLVRSARRVFSVTNTRAGPACG